MTPFFRSSSRKGSWMSSSAGVIIRRIRPERPSSAPGCFSAMATPSSAAPWAWCPQAWAMPWMAWG